MNFFLKKVKAESKMEINDLLSVTNNRHVKKTTHNKNVRLPSCILWMNFTIIPHSIYWTNPGPDFFLLGILNTGFILQFDKDRWSLFSLRSLRDLSSLL